jgi:NAD(P)-dependent dehydrogenase (short-subunit alcohol dehydrogenase family)
VSEQAGDSLSDLFDLTGKVAVVTGGSRGLGREIVRAYACRGATVVIASRNQAACDELASQVSGEYGAIALGVPCHVGHWDECDRLVDTVYAKFGRIDVLVNNAGMSPLYPSLPEVTEALYDKVMAVNLKGPFRLGSLAGARMREAGEGCILNISSIAAVRPTSDEIPYAAAKAGLNTLTKGLAVTYGPEVRVNAIMAGPFLTDVSKAWDTDAFAHTAETGIALRRGGRPDEIVGAALYLTTRASSYCTGAVLTVDGGST